MPLYTITLDLYVIYLRIVFGMVLVNLNLALARECSLIYAIGCSGPPW
jgi:hypothetical protein